MATPVPSISDFQNQTAFRAPADNAQSLIVPSLSLALKEQLGFGAVRPAAAFQVGKKSIGQLRDQARRDALAAALQYTAGYRELWFDPTQYANQAQSSPWVVAGHQPELFHPGVWFKNFLISQAAQQTTCVSLNLVIDNDLCRSPAIRVPVIEDQTGSPMIRTESVAFDSPSPPVAWECRSILDRDCLRSFPDRVQQVWSQGGSERLLSRLWPHVLSAAERSGRLGLALAQGRHALEGELGLRTLELPLSLLSQQRSFAEFSLAILADLPRFQTIYNEQRTAYRLANGIRSQSHPVPALQTRHGWFEAPWWVYRESEPTRRRLFVRFDGDDLILSDQAGWQTTIEGPLASDDACMDWMQLAIDGVLLRPRALITTMFVRLTISDVFVHGIGGGKYDQMTDAIIRQYFEVPAPSMVVATATLRLPLAERLQLGSLQKNAADRQAVSASAWHMRYHPEQHIQSVNEETQQLLERKQALLAAIPPRGEKWEWHREITQLNRRLAELNESSMLATQQHLQELSLQTRQLQIANSREFSFCLFETNYAVDVLRRLAAVHFDLPVAK